MQLFLLSPHYDDICFSINSFLNNFKLKFKNITIINIYTISKYIENKEMYKFIYNKNELAKILYTSIIRKNEDLHFIKKHNFKNIELKLFDSGIYKKNVFHNKNFNIYFNDLFLKLFTIFNKIDDKIILLCPLGIGKHSDHLETFNTIIKIKSILKDQLVLFFYFDMPYSTYFDNINTRMLEIKNIIKNYSIFKKLLSNIDINNKINDILIYNSQLKFNISYNDILNNFFIKDNNNYYEYLLFNEIDINLIQ